VPCEAGDLDGGDILRIPGDDLLVLYFNMISDSGVRIFRVSSVNGSVRWTSACKPLGVVHSLYRQWATASLEGNRIRVTSRGSYGSFVEWLDAGTGKQMSRTEKKGLE
jgi:hypothetical protein